MWAITTKIPQDSVAPRKLAKIRRDRYKAMITRVSEQYLNGLYLKILFLVFNKQLSSRPGTFSRDCFTLWSPESAENWNPFQLRSTIQSSSGIYLGFGSYMGVTT